jgi:hypothetical protein
MCCDFVRAFGGQCRRVSVHRARDLMAGHTFATTTAQPDVWFAVGWIGVRVGWSLLRVAATAAVFHRGPGSQLSQKLVAVRCYAL